MSVTDMINEPISTHRYKIYDVCDLPKVVLCISIKSKYDEYRLNINPKYNPQYITHFRTHNDELYPHYYYGVELNVTPRITKMLEAITAAGLFKQDTIDNRQKLNLYNNLLHQYNLTCNTCYGYFNDGVCPIDMCHLQAITDNDFGPEISTGFGSMLTPKKKGDPDYPRLINFNILTFIRATGYDN